MILVLIKEKKKTADDLYYFDHIDDSTLYGKKRNNSTLCLYIINQEKSRYGEIERTIK